MTLNVMLDSGAYSARHAGRVISPEGYRDYAVANARHVHKVVALDVIPGLVPAKKGRPARLITPKESAKTGYDNWRMMKKAGVDAMPVFHRGEAWDVLDRYLADGAKWVGVASRGSDLWLDAVFTKYPGVKFHGFGETRLPVLLAHPWHSVDSRTAIQCAMNGGQVFVPSDDTDTLGLVFFATGDTKYPHRHYRFLPPRERRRIQRIVESYGSTVEELSRSKEEGGTAICATHNAVVLNRIVLERATNPALRIFHAVSSPGQDPFGDRPDIPDRLISYAFLDGGKPGDLAAYAGG